MAEISGWQDFFLDISKLSDSAERQYGVAQLNYTEYILERLALCIDLALIFKKSSIHLHRLLNSKNVATL